VAIAGAEDLVVELDRGALTSACIEAEDGRDGGLAIVHLRYDAAGAAVTETDDRYVYRPGSGGALLEGASRRAMAQLLSELALDGPDNAPAPEPIYGAAIAVEPEPEPATEPEPAAVSDERPTAVYPAQRPAAFDDGYDYRDNEYVPVPRQPSPYQPRGHTASETLAAMNAALADRRQL
jgi:hypothetical protein